MDVIGNVLSECVWDGPTNGACGLAIVHLQQDVCMITSGLHIR